jgi:cell division protein FtsW
VVLAFMAMLMVLLGIVMVLSAASVQDLRIHGNAWYHQRRQLIWVVLGLAGLVATSRLDYRRLKPMAVWLLVGSVVLLLAVFIPGIGIRANGSSRWIGVGAATFQPSELAKLAVILYGSVLLSSRPVNDLRGTVLPLAAVLGGVGALVYAEPDLGTTIILAAIAASLLFFAGLRLAIVGATAALGISMMGAMTMTAGYRRERLLSMFDPWSDPLNTGWQAIQSGVAMSNGGLWGMGLGASRAKWGFLPFAQTDFIFAIVAEELGFVAGLGVILVYLVIGLVGLNTALRAPDRLGQLLAAGITTWIMIQAYVNIGAVLGVLPITGVPLPFVSYGGSSMVLTLTAYGVLLNVARQTP